MGAVAVGVGVGVSVWVAVGVGVDANVAFDVGVKGAVGDLVKGSSVARNASHRRLGGIVDERSCRECAPPPREVTPKGSSHLPPVWATLGQLDHFVALALQQNGQQSALRKSQV